MWKKILAAVLALCAAAAFAAVDVNKASQADLETIKGIGPVISAKILDERKKASFKDWQDMITRVKGIGEHNAATFSSEGLTVNGASFSGAPAKPATASKSKAAAKPSATPAAANTAAPATAAAATPATAASSAKPMSAAEKRAQAKSEKAEKKAQKGAKAGAPAASAAAK